MAREVNERRGGSARLQELTVCRSRERASDAAVVEEGRNLRDFRSCCRKIAGRVPNGEERTRRGLGRCRPQQASASDHGGRRVPNGQVVE